MSKCVFIFLLLFATQNSSASFRENSRRYLSPKDMATLLLQKFPVVGDIDQVDKYKDRRGRYIAEGGVPVSCWGVGLRNSSATGVTIPAVGAPATTEPGAAFVRWWGYCADKVVAKQMAMLSLRPADEPLWRKYWLQELLTKFRDKKKPADPFHKFNEIPWSDLTSAQRHRQIRFLIEEMIGPNAVVAEAGFAKGIDDLAAQIRKIVPDDSPLMLNEVNRTLITAVALREEFITY